MIVSKPRFSFLNSNDCFETPLFVSNLQLSFQNYAFCFQWRFTASMLDFCFQPHLFVSNKILLFQIDLYVSNIVSDACFQSSSHRTHPKYGPFYMDSAINQLIGHFVTSFWSSSSPSHPLYKNYDGFQSLKL